VVTAGDMYFDWSGSSLPGLSWRKGHKRSLLLLFMFTTY